MKDLFNRHGNLVITGDEIQRYSTIDGVIDFSALVRSVEVSNFGWDLSGWDLSGCHFSDTHLEAPLFRGANLSDAWFDGAWLEQADFTDAVLTDARFYRANAHACRFNGADFTDASMEDADLRYCILEGAVNLLNAAQWHELARGNGREVTVAQLGGRQVVFVLDQLFTAYHSWSVDEFMEVSDKELLSHGGWDTVDWRRKYRSALLLLLDAHVNRGSHG